MFNDQSYFTNIYRPIIYRAATAVSPCGTPMEQKDFPYKIHAHFNIAFYYSFQPEPGNGMD